MNGQLCLFRQKPLLWSLPTWEGLLQELKEVIVEAVADSTAKGYDRYWLSFAEEHGLVPLPADPDLLCAYFLHLCTMSDSLAPALSTRSAIGFFHKLSSFPVEVQFSTMVRKFVKESLACHCPQLPPFQTSFTRSMSRTGEPSHNLHFCLSKLLWFCRISQ